MSAWGAHPLPGRTNLVALRYLPRGGCSYCRPLWRAGYDRQPCQRCSPGPGVPYGVMREMISRMVRARIVAWQAPPTDALADIEEMLAQFRARRAYRGRA